MKSNIDIKPDQRGRAFFCTVVALQEKNIDYEDSRTMAQRNDERTVQDRPGTGRHSRWNNSIGYDCLGLGRY